MTIQKCFSNPYSIGASVGIAALGLGGWAHATSNPTANAFVLPAHEPVSKPLIQKNFDVFKKQAGQEVSLKNDWKLGLLSHTVAHQASPVPHSGLHKQMGAIAYLGKEWEAASQQGVYQWRVQAGSTLFENVQSASVSSQSAVQAGMWHAKTEWSYQHTLDQHWSVTPFMDWNTQVLSTTHAAQAGKALWGNSLSETSQYQSDIMVGTRVHYQPDDTMQLTVGVGVQQVLQRNNTLVPIEIREQPGMRWNTDEQDKQALRVDLQGAITISDAAQFTLGYRAQWTEQQAQQSLSFGWKYQF